MCRFHNWQGRLSCLRMGLLSPASASESSCFPSPGLFYIHLSPSERAPLPRLHFLLNSLLLLLTPLISLVSLLPYIIIFLSGTETDSYKTQAFRKTLSSFNSQTPARSAWQQTHLPGHPPSLGRDVIPVEGIASRQVGGLPSVILIPPSKALPRGRQQRPETLACKSVSTLMAGVFACHQLRYNTARVQPKHPWGLGRCGQQAASLGTPRTHHAKDPLSAQKNIYITYGCDAGTCAEPHPCHCISSRKKCQRFRCTMVPMTFGGASARGWGSTTTEHLPSSWLPGC